MKLDPYTGKANYRGWPKGVDNRRADYDVADDALRDGVNVDISNSGRVQMRRGITQAVAMAGAHSVFSDGARMIWATPTTLRLAGASLTPSLLLTDARLANPLSYVTVNGDTYFSNEQINGKISAAGVYSPWGVVPPATQPVCTGSPVGSGVARQYQVSCTFITAIGEESGSNLLPVLVLCGESPTIVASSIPQSSDPRVIATRLYVTNIDGEIFYRNQDVPVGVTTVAMTGFFGTGGSMDTQFGLNPPPGQLLEYYNGRIYIAAGNVVWFTDALNYNIHYPIEGFLFYPERVTLLKAVVDGLFISSDKTYFVERAGADDVTQRVVLPHRAVEGAACGLPDTRDVIWFSERGFVRGGDGGKVQMITDNQLAVDKYTRGALSFDENDGRRSIIAALTGPTMGNPANDFVAADAVRRAEIL